MNRRGFLGITAGAVAGLQRWKRPVAATPVLVYHAVEIPIRRVVWSTRWELLPDNTAVRVVEGTIMLAKPGENPDPALLLASITQQCPAMNLQPGFRRDLLRICWNPLEKRLDWKATDSELPKVSS